MDRLRQAEGLLTSLFVLMGLDLRAPDHTTLSRRGRHLDPSLRPAPKRAGLHLIIDSSGLSIVGEGEWAAAKPGRRGRRGWKKLYLGVDQTGVIVVVPPAKTSRDEQRARIENACFRYTSMIGDGLRAKTPGGRTAETARVQQKLIMMTDMGRPNSHAIGR